MSVKKMKVSVLMITYNQERYISQALDSVLMQEVSFDYEIVIGEDCSTDGTRQIVSEYQQRFPERIRALLPQNNLGMLRNFAETYYACAGEYVAILEGDDFWTCSNKLQKQVDFLDQHPETALCFHTTEVFYQENDAPNYLFPVAAKEFYTVEDLLRTNFIQTCSVMFRNRLFGDFPPWFFSGIIGDYPLHLLNARYGNIGYINEVLGSYRIHSAGVWSMQMENNLVRNVLAGIKMYKNLDQYFDYKYHNIIRDVLFKHESTLLKRYVKDKNFYDSAKQVMKLLFKYPYHLLSYKPKPKDAAC